MYLLLLKNKKKNMSKMKIDTCQLRRTNHTLQNRQQSRKFNTEVHGVDSQNRQQTRTFNNKYIVVAIAT